MAAIKVGKKARRVKKAAVLFPRKSTGKPAKNLQGGEE
jgi:hypothetical protein